MRMTPIMNPFLRVWKLPHPITLTIRRSPSGFMWSDIYLSMMPQKIFRWSGCLDMSFQYFIWTNPEQITPYVAESAPYHAYLPPCYVFDPATFYREDILWGELRSAVANANPDIALLYLLACAHSQKLQESAFAYARHAKVTSKMLASFPSTLPSDLIPDILFSPLRNPPTLYNGPQHFLEWIKSFA